MLAGLVQRGCGAERQALWSSCCIVGWVIWSQSEMLQINTNERQLAQLWVLFASKDRIRRVAEEIDHYSNTVGHKIGSFYPYDNRYNLLMMP